MTLYCTYLLLKRMELHTAQKKQIIEMTKILATQLKRAKKIGTDELIKKAETNLNNFVSEIFMATEDEQLKNEMESWKHLADISKL